MLLFFAGILYYLLRNVLLFCVFKSLSRLIDTKSAIKKSFQKPGESQQKKGNFPFFMTVSLRKVQLNDAKCVTLGALLNWIGNTRLNYFILKTCVTDASLWHWWHHYGTSAITMPLVTHKFCARMSKNEQK